MEPAGWVGHRLDCRLKDSRVLASQPFPRMVRPGNILHGPVAKRLVFFHEIEGTKVDRLKSPAVRHVERDSDETPLLLPLPFQVDLQRPFTKLESSHRRQ